MTNKDIFLEILTLVKEQNASLKETVRLRVSVEALMTKMNKLLTRLNEG